MKNLENRTIDSSEQPKETISEKKTDTIEDAAEKEEYPEFKKDLEALKEQEEQTKIQVKERGHQGILSQLYSKGRKLAGVAVLSLASFAAGCRAETETSESFRPPTPISEEKINELFNKVKEKAEEEKPIEVPIAKEAPIEAPIEALVAEEIEEEKKEEKTKKEEEIKITPQEKKFAEELSFNVKKSIVSPIGGGYFLVDIGSLGLYKIGPRRVKEIIDIQRKWETIYRNVMHKNKSRNLILQRLEEAKKNLELHMKSEIIKSVREEINLNQEEAISTIGERTAKEEKVAAEEWKQKAKAVKAKNSKIISH
ncbi:MAG: hypothetical protein CEN87_124 [Parcubacteria group bacterium Licking1014_1]|nr:MAG: hypothetical protein CEN87_124 [Parcubacteria group bacterium Licking1014_1]